MSSRVVFKFILGTGAALGVLDLALLHDDTPGNTYSSVLQSQIWAHGLLSFIAVHICRPAKSKQIEVKGVSTWLVTASGAVIAVGGGVLLGGGYWGLALGALSGYFFWGNSGKT